MELESAIRNIVNEVLAEREQVSAKPDLISPAELVKRHDALSKDIVYDLVRESDTNGFPCIRLGKRNILIDYRRFTQWLDNGGIGGKS